VPLTIDKIKVKLDFHIFDILDFDLPLGYYPEKLLRKMYLKGA
jgi:adenine-specific DNA methylase